MSNPDILVIDMNERWCECHVCGKETPAQWGLALDDCGRLALPGCDDWRGGVAACHSCFEAHAQGFLTADNEYEWRHRGELERRAMQAAFARE